MGNAKYDNALYEHTKASINKALHMEWVIRAIQSSARVQYQALQSIDSRLHDVWRQKGFSDDEIMASELKDYSWDALQVGRICSRTYTRVYNHDVFTTINEGIKEVKTLLEKDVSKISLPAIAKDYRYCDLLNGNDIPRLLKKIQTIRQKFGEYSKSDSIPFNEFASFVRVPTKIHSESLIIDGAGVESNGLRLNNAIMLTIRTDVKIEDFKGILDEFVLEYCKRRMAYLEKHPEADPDDLSTKLITEVLHREMFDVPVVVDRHDGLIGHLVGLYYWDSVQSDKKISSKTIADNLSKDCNIWRDDSTVRRDHHATRTEIEALILEVKRSF
jgi:hypothetical protein